MPSKASKPSELDKATKAGSLNKSNPTKKVKKPASFKKRLLVTAVIVLAICIPSVVFADQITSGWRSLTGKPVSNTSEIYFDDSKLPDKLKVNQNYKVPFVIINREGENLIYRYQIEIITGSGKQVSSEQRIVVKSGEKVIKNVDLKLKKLNSEAELIIRLLDHNQTVNLKLRT